ncbi:MAG: hypothetical protein A2157_08030 [Deltaproteobacteria bacterium RBG_16_47_11]|nr:MAG: hypothetical protein A2157_08030 [Deltaproteobacteria bacterium RBG_16_47_11]
MPLFDLQTVGFWVLKTAGSIADIEPHPKGDSIVSSSIIASTCSLRNRSGSRRLLIEMRVYP